MIRNDSIRESYGSIYSRKDGRNQEYVNTCRYCIKKKKTKSDIGE